jgi:phi13 family phage major tail protein
MAAIGLRYLAYAPLTEDPVAGTFEYGTGKVGRKMINANISLNISDTPLYADDNVAERVKEFIDGTIAIGQDELTDTMRTDFFGNVSTDETVGETTVKNVTSKDTDTSPMLGVAFIQTKIIDNARKYRAVLLTKTQFGEANETGETKGQNISWQTPTINGALMRRIDGVWKEEITADSLATAVAWIKGKFNMT